MITACLPSFHKLSFHSVVSSFAASWVWQFAIKIVAKGTIADVADIERVYRETFILTSLKHPNVIKLYEVCRGWIVHLP